MASWFEHILVPVDFTEKNRAALQVAQELTSRSGCRVTLLHVIETIEYLEGRELDDFYAMLEGQARENLAGLAHGLSRADRMVDQEVTYGKRALEIVQYALEHDVDLVVLSSHKVGLDQPGRGWGTLSYQVSILCQCPVLLVK